MACDFCSRKDNSLCDYCQDFVTVYNGPPENMAQFSRINISSGEDVLINPVNNDNPRAKAKEPDLILC